MRHEREDYDRIQDPLNLIASDEPVFLLRAKDETAPKIVRAWAAEQRGSEGGDIEAARLADYWAEVMEIWQENNGSKMPDLPPAYRLP